MSASHNGSAVDTRGLVVELNKGLYSRGHASIPGTGFAISNRSQVYISPGHLPLDQVSTSQIETFNSNSAHTNNSPDIIKLEVSEDSDFSSSPYSKLYLSILKAWPGCECVVLGQPRAALLAAELGNSSFLPLRNWELLSAIVPLPQGDLAGEPRQERHSLQEEVGQKEAGSQETGLQEAGRQEEGPQEAGPSCELRLPIISNSVCNLSASVIKTLATNSSTSALIIRRFGLLVIGKTWKTAKIMFDAYVQLLELEWELVKYGKGSPAKLTQPDAQTDSQPVAVSVSQRKATRITTPASPASQLTVDNNSTAPATPAGPPTSMHENRPTSQKNKRGSGAAISTNRKAGGKPVKQAIGWTLAARGGERGGQVGGSRSLTRDLALKRKKAALDRLKHGSNRGGISRNQTTSTFRPGNINRDSICCPPSNSSFSRDGSSSSNNSFPCKRNGSNSNRFASDASIFNSAKVSAFPGDVLPMPNSSGHHEATNSFQTRIDSFFPEREGRFMPDNERPFADSFYHVDRDFRRRNDSRERSVESGGGDAEPQFNPCMRITIQNHPLAASEMATRGEGSGHHPHQFSPPGPGHSSRQNSAPQLNFPASEADAGFMDDGEGVFGWEPMSNTFLHPNFVPPRIGSGRGSSWQYSSKGSAGMRHVAGHPRNIGNAVNAVNAATFGNSTRAERGNKRKKMKNSREGEVRVRADEY